MTIPFYRVDAFTNEPFRGNPAAVCLLTESKDAVWMQRVAAEINIGMTAFVQPKRDGYHLRWFTPIAEVPICGHATLASAHVLWETGKLRPDAPAHFETLSGRLSAAKSGDWISLDFPEIALEPVDAPPHLLDALGTTTPLFVGRSTLDYLVRLGSAEEVRRMTPDFRALLNVPMRGVAVTAASDRGDADFILRFFAPSIGNNEDPVTGSIHCCLSPYWAQELGQRELTCYQASPRGGVVRIRVAEPRVHLSGHAVTIFQGALL